jgi:hypothetical protein
MNTPRHKHYEKIVLQILKGDPKTMVIASLEEIVKSVDPFYPAKIDSTFKTFFKISTLKILADIRIL